MVTLYHFMRIWGIPDGSPFCVKLETYLRMAKIEYKPDTTFDIRKSPKGKMPLIEHKGQLISDTSFIIDYLKKEFGDSLDTHLSDRQKAEGLCIQRLVEEHLYWVMVYFRWVPEEAWKQLKPAFFGHMPMPLKLFVPDLLRKNIINQLKGHGLGRHSEEEIVKIARDDLQALSNILENKSYFLGEKPTSYDASVFGLLTNLYQCPIPSPIKSVALELKNLVGYEQHLTHEYFSDLDK